MNLPICVSAVCLTLVVVAPLRGADTPVERLATCQDSWQDWRDDQAKMGALAQAFNASFALKKDGTFAPKGTVRVVGLPVVQAFPESVGMAVGFSVVLDANFADARQSTEKALGKSLGKCETGEGMRTCELEIAPKRTVTLMTEEASKPPRTLLGCYYEYQK